MSFRQFAARDEILYMNIGYLLLTIIALPPALLFLYAFSLDDPVMSPPLVWLFGVAATTAVQILRPYYPFRILMDVIPAEQLTLRQRKALTFLKSSEAKDLALSVGSGISAAMGAIVLLAVLCPGEEYLPTFLRRSGVRPGGLDLLLGNLLGIFIAGFLTFLAVLTAHVGLSCWYILRHWERIQATYPPWPVTDLNRHFTYGLKEPKGRAVGGTGRPLPPPEHPVPNPLTRSISARDALAFVCYLIGAPGLLVSVDSGIRSLLRLPELTLEAALWPLGVPAASAGLLVLGWWLRRSR